MINQETNFSNFLVFTNYYFKIDDLKKKGGKNEIGKRIHVVE